MWAVTGIWRQDWAGEADGLLTPLLSGGLSYSSQGLSIWLLTTQKLSFLRASGPWESRRVFLWPNLRNDKPSLLLHSIGHTGNWYNLGRNYTRAWKPGGRNHWEPSWIWAVTVMNWQILWLMSFHTSPQILWYFSHQKVKPNSPPLLNVGCTYNSNKWQKWQYQTSRVVHETWWLLPFSLSQINHSRERKLPCGDNIQET